MTAITAAPIDAAGEDVERVVPDPEDAKFSSNSMLRPSTMRWPTFARRSG